MNFFPSGIKKGAPHRLPKEHAPCCYGPGSAFYFACRLLRRAVSAGSSEPLRIKAAGVISGPTVTVLGHAERRGAHTDHR